MKTKTIQSSRAMSAGSHGTAPRAKPPRVGLATPLPDRARTTPDNAAPRQKPRLDHANAGAGDEPVVSREKRKLARAKANTSAATSVAGTINIESKHAVASLSWQTPTTDSRRNAGARSSSFKTQLASPHVAQTTSVEITADVFIAPRATLPHVFVSGPLKAFVR